MAINGDSIHLAVGFMDRVVRPRRKVLQPFAGAVLNESGRYIRTLMLTINICFARFGRVYLQG